MKRITKSQPKKALARKSAKAKTPSTERGTNAAEEKAPVQEKVAAPKENPYDAKKHVPVNLPPAGAGRTVTSPTPADE